MHESLFTKSEGCIIFYQVHVFLFLHLRYAIKVDLLWDKYFLMAFIHGTFVEPLKNKVFYSATMHCFDAFDTNYIPTLLIDDILICKN